MEYTKLLDNGACKIVMHGKFTFSDHMEFKKIIAIFDEGNLEKMELDVSGITFVDSAALGLLLLALEEAKKKSLPLIILKPTGQVQKMFKVSRFYELFKVLD